MKSPPKSDPEPPQPGYEGFGDYMERKRVKLSEQQKSIEQKSDLFKDIRFHVNGYTDPPAAVLKELVVSHGGDYEPIYRHQPGIYMLATHLPKAKIDKMTDNQTVIRPQWVLDCIQAGSLLDLKPYRLYGEKEPAGLDQFLKPKGKKGESIDKTEKVTSSNRTSATDPNFVQNFYKSSRLHHLSTWREDLKRFATELMKEKHPDGSEAGAKSLWILHIDMDCFFVSVSARDRPELDGLPVGISHSASNSGKEGSSSDLASVNYEARAFGLKNGMYTRRALELCPTLTILPYDFEAYQEVAYELYRILAKHADVLQAVSCDEAFVGIEADDEEQIDNIARAIRDEIFATCRCHASIGIGHNILLARLATKRAKPRGQFRVSEEDVESFMSKQKLEDLPGVGPSISAKLAAEGFKLCKDLIGVPVERLQALLGPKLGLSLHQHARGIDLRQLEGDQQRKSVGTEISWGVRFETVEQRDHFVLELTREVISRLASIQPAATAKRMNIKLMKRQADAGEPGKRLGRGFCDTLHKVVPLSGKLTAESLASAALKAIDSFCVPVSEIRGIGIFLVNLEEPAKGYDWAQHAKFTPKPKLDPKESYLQARGCHPAIFAELPPETQEELLHEWGFYAQDEIPTTPKKQDKKSKKKESPAKASVSVMDMLRGNKKKSSFPERHELIQLGIDPEFFEALPDCLKTEVLQASTTTDQVIAPPVIEIDCTPPVHPSVDFRQADLSSDHALALMYDLLEKHDYEQVTAILSEIKDRPGASELIDTAQKWFKRNEGGSLYIP